MHNLTNFFELSMANPRAELRDERSMAVANLPAEFNEHTVLVNLNGVTSINSRGIALFMEAMQHITEHGGNLVLFGVRDDVRRVFETTRLDQVFHIYSTREEALADQCSTHRDTNRA